MEKRLSEGGTSVASVEQQIAWVRAQLKKTRGEQGSGT